MRRTRFRLRADQGTITPLVLIMTTGIFVVIGMAYDIGGEFDAEQRATMLAQEAARAGAQAVDVPRYLDTGVAAVNTVSANGPTADQAVQAFCAQANLPQTTCTTIVAGGTEVQVNVAINLNIVILPGGVNKTVYGHAEVKLTQGVTDSGG
jgi:hypothetical protein